MLSTPTGEAGTRRPLGWLPPLRIVRPALLCMCVAGCEARTAAARVELPLASDMLKPVVVTERVLGDSDDPAIWLNPTNPAGSLVLGTDKNDSLGGVYVFDLAGRVDRTRTVTPLRRMNNVDVVSGVRLGGPRMDIAAATERNRMALRVFELPDMRPLDCGGIRLFDGDTVRAPMGVALYQRPRDGAVFAIVGGKSGPRDGTYLWQYRLELDGAGCVRGVKVREFGAYSGRAEIEAIAVDDSLGYVYYSDEQAGVRKYHADPDAGNQELALFATSDFIEDHEGIGIFRGENGRGYLLVSDQSGGRLHVFAREGTKADPHAHPVLAVIPVSAVHTDGLEVTSSPVGPAFPKGMLVMMSDDGTFHFYRWEDVKAGIDSARHQNAR